MNILNLDAQLWALWHLKYLLHARFEATASRHCNFAAPDTGTTFRAGGANVIHLVSLFEDMAVALIFNLCFLHQKSAGNSAGIVSLVTQMRCLPCPELEQSPGPLQNDLCVGMSIYFPPHTNTFQQGLIPGFSEKLSRWLKITLWPQDYGLLRESCLKQTGKDQAGRVVLSCLQ